MDITKWHKEVILKASIKSQNNANLLYYKYNNGEKIKIVGILKPDEDNTLSIGTGGIGYRRDLMDFAINENKRD